MGPIYDRAYWIGFRAEFTGRVFKSSLHIRFIG